MGFADVYLLKAGLRESLINSEPYPDLDIIVTIPVHNESGLERCLDSLFQSALFATGSVSGSPQAEVLILVNAAGDAPAEVLGRNLLTLASAEEWIENHPHPSIRFHIWSDHTFGKKEAGVGLARKILMDEAVRRFSAIGKPEGIVASLDADAMVDPNYLEALVSHFGSGGSGSDGCSVYFEHPLEPGDSGSHGDCGTTGDSPDPREPAGRFGHEIFPSEVYGAIAQYELHLRYYLHAVRSTGYPYAYHTVGSAFAVRSDVYCMEGGMNRRQGGEDFYFIQKVAQRGNFSECNTTRVVPSPRPSSRVPFGTGPVVERLVNDKAGGSGGDAAGATGLMTYHPAPFRMLKELFSRIDELGGRTIPGTILETLSGVLREFLDSQQFAKVLVEMRTNSASPSTFRKRFWRWFNMFRIMKFLHFAREMGYPDMAVADAATGLCPEATSGELSGILRWYRDKDRETEEENRD